MEIYSFCSVKYGLKCRQCGKKYLGNYNVKLFGECKCGYNDWIEIEYNGRCYVEKETVCDK